MTSLSGMPPMYTPTIHAKRERKNADVQLGEATDEDRDDQRGERHVRKIHSRLNQFVMASTTRRNPSADCALQRQTTTRS